jgi:hypothetical protein
MMKKIENTPSIEPVTSSNAPSNDDHTAKSPPCLRVVEIYRLFWLDSNIDESDSDFKHSLAQLREVVNTIHTFTDADQCVNSLNQIEDEKVFMIVSGALGQSTVPNIHHLSQLDSVYVFCRDKAKHQEWTKEWLKIKDVCTGIDSICDRLKQDTQQCDRDSVSISVTSGDLNHLQPSFFFFFLFCSGNVTLGSAYMIERKKWRYLSQKQNNQCRTFHSKLSISNTASIG